MAPKNPAAHPGFFNVLAQQEFLLYVSGMRTITIIIIIAILILGIGIASHAQNASQEIYAAINTKREHMKLPPLIYRIGNQVSVEDRANEISFDFRLSDECDCDYESIAGDYSLQALINKITNTQKYDWLHFEKNARFASVAVIKREGIFYCVIRTYIQ